MNLQKVERLLVLLKQYGVSHYKTLELEIQVTGQGVAVQQMIHSPEKESRPASSAPPVDMEIPHHENQVASLMKLSDEALVDKLFPDYTQEEKAD